MAEQLVSFSGAKEVTIILQESLSVLDNNWSAMPYDGGIFFLSRKYPIHLVVRVGGDSFGAGLIYGLLSGWDTQKSLEFVVTASALKQMIPGDMNLVNKSEINCQLRFFRKSSTLTLNNKF